MSKRTLSMKTYKAIITMLILTFSLSPCSVKRNVLDIFDIQYISGLNKVKTTSGPSFSCDAGSVSSQISVSKAQTAKDKGFLSGFRPKAKNREKEEISFNEYSGHATGNSPPKYILFKRLKLNLV